MQKDALSHVRIRICLLLCILNWRGGGLITLYDEESLATNGRIARDRLYRAGKCGLGQRQRARNERT